MKMWKIVKSGGVGPTQNIWEESGGEDEEEEEYHKMYLVL